MPDENTACHSVDRPYLHQPKGRPRFPFPYSRPVTLLLSSSAQTILLCSPRRRLLTLKYGLLQLPERLVTCVVAQSMDRASAGQSMDCPRKARIHALRSAIHGLSRSMVCA